MKHLFRNRFSLICIILGAAIILSAVGMLVASRISANQAKADAAKIVEKLQKLIPPAVDCVPEERGDNAMASLQIDGVDVIAMLEIPKYGKVLPVASKWDTNRVAYMPCRFVGSIYDSSLIIGAVDSEDQIPFANKLDVDVQILLTDTEGGRYSYRIAAIQHAKHATLEKLQQGDYALTIYVKDSKTSEYLLIRCNSGR